MMHGSQAHRLTKALATNLQHRGPSPTKAREMLKDGMVHGQALTKKQKGYFGAILGRSR